MFKMDYKMLERKNLKEKTYNERKRMNDTHVWVEKYRPKIFEDIVLDPMNKQILKNIIETGHFPNLLFYGPPGTGKTTTIINLINAYQEKTNVRNKEMVIHLNASDERGIDVIRNQIIFFVNSKPLFNNGMKFVILDEVDYMTKNAQQALRYLLQNYSNSARFCLICNYMSKIDDGLQTEFMRLRFNQLPKKLIFSFLTNISIQEKLNVSSETILKIQEIFHSDIRSMINFIQSNQSIFKTNKCEIIDGTVWNTLLKQIEIESNKDTHTDKNTDVHEEIKSDGGMEKINDHIHQMSKTYNIDKKNMMKSFLTHIIRNHNHSLVIDDLFLCMVENIMHNQNINNHTYVNYIIHNLSFHIKLKQNKMLM
jgi:replication factor C subunit 3/5